jgi:uncharacterized membrane protein
MMFLHSHEHLNNVGVIAGLVNSSYQTSAIMIYVVVAGSEWFPLPYAFLGLSLFAWLSALLAAVILPTQREFYDQQRMFVV